VRAFRLGYSALAHQDSSDWARANTLTAEAETLVVDLGLTETLHNLPVRTARVALAARAHDGAATSAELDAVAGLLTFTRTAPWMLADLSVRCAEAALAIGDREAATTFAGLTRRALARVADAGVTPARLERFDHLMLPPDPVLDLLTPAERRVLAELPTHRTIAEIAERQFVGRSTVKTHVSSIYSKLGVNSRAEAVALFHGNARARPGTEPSDHTRA
jgi:DNA-binding CsgD family transcriptional regulator